MHSTHTRAHKQLIIMSFTRNILFNSITEMLLSIIRPYTNNARNTTLVWYVFNLFLLLLLLLGLLLLFSDCLPFNAIFAPEAVMCVCRYAPLLFCGECVRCVLLTSTTMMLIQSWFTHVPAIYKMRHTIYRTCNVHYIQIYIYQIIQTHLNVNITRNSR